MYSNIAFVVLNHFIIAVATQEKYFGINKLDFSKFYVPGSEVGVKILHDFAAEKCKIYIFF